MLTQVDVQSEVPMALEIRDSKPTDSIILKKIDGLGPPSVDLFLGEYARDGGVYGGRRVPPRNITILVELNPNYEENETVDGLRLLLYKAFMDPFVATDGLRLLLHDDTVGDRYVEGHTEKLEPDIFSPDTNVVISMRCPNPYILDDDLTIVPAAGPTQNFNYGGSAETGLMIDAVLTGATTVLTLALNSTNQMFLDYGFANQDRLRINTRRGERNIQVGRPKNVTNRELSGNVATLTSNAHGYSVGDEVVVSDVPTDTFFNGVWTITAVTANTFSYDLVHADVVSTATAGAIVYRYDNILYALDSDNSTWLELHALSNQLSIYGADPMDNKANLTEISFRGQHWGV